MDVASVLVPLDGSAAAAAALPYAEAIVRATGASLLLLTVVDQKHEDLMGSPAVREHLERLHRDQQQEYLGASAAKLAEKGVAAATLVRVGDPVDEILAAAERSEVGIVVLASHGHGGLQHWLIGGVADKVMRSCSKPVLIVRPPQPPQPQPRVELKSLMVPLDGSKLAEAALAPAAELAQATDGVITLVRVEPFLARSIPGTEFVPDLGSEDEGLAEHGMVYLDQVKGRLPASLQVDTLLLRGGVEENLTEFALHQGIDLTVMSTHGHGGLRRLVMGSTADRLVRAGVPLLLIHPDSEAV